MKLMGRHSGHIAMYSVLASRDVDVCLIPEIKFVLGGPRVSSNVKASISEDSKLALLVISVSISSHCSPFLSFSRR